MFIMLQSMNTVGPFPWKRQDNCLIQFLLEQQNMIRGVGKCKQNPCSRINIMLTGPIKTYYFNLVNYAVLKFLSL